MPLQPIDNPYYPTALLLAYDYAVDILRGEFQATDHKEVLAVASAYALEHWRDWIHEAEVADARAHTESAENSRLQHPRFVRLAGTLGRYRRCRNEPDTGRA